MLDKILDAPLSEWLKDTNDKEHIVISSRIRLARNFKDILFTNRNDEESLKKVDAIGKGLLSTLRQADSKEFSNISLDKLSDVERAALVEKHLISPALAEKLLYRGLIVSADGSVAIMVNEEDHLRIQIMEAGLNLRKAYEHAIVIDDAIEAKHSYAFHETYGYLTACPTNVGTGMRASVMLHLPALAMTEKINRLIRSIIQLGYSVRGLYGEGSEALGHIFQVSNQRTLGASEDETIEQLQKIVEGIVAEEQKCRTALQQGDVEAFEDRLWRSYGVLKYARRISGQEALSLLSDAQLGMDMGILPTWKSDVFNELVATTRPNFLSKYAEKDTMTSSERDSYRAKIIRQKLD